LLRTCNDWNRIQPLGLVNHKSLIAAWNGVLVELDHQLYFVRKETLAALHDRISWQFPRTITVVE
jgi:hypothetical protein